jgi:hypothetical protein
MTRTGKQLARAVVARGTISILFKAVPGVLHFVRQLVSLIKNQNGKIAPPPPPSVFNMANDQYQPVSVTSKAMKKMNKPTITKRKEAENAPIFLRSKL